jgi:hypothetical protein
MPLLASSETVFMMTEELREKPGALGEHVTGGYTSPLSQKSFLIK